MGKRDLTYYNKFQPKVNFINEYAKASNAATGSKYDANANVESKNVTTLTGEMHKDDDIGINRLRMIQMITKMYGEDLAKEYIRQLEDHEIYRHDETHPVYPYCVSITLYPFLLDGLGSVGGPSSAPKNLNSFAGNFINLVFAVAAQFAGAVATPEFLVYLDYFIRLEYGDDYYLHTDRVVEMTKKQRTLEKKIIDVFEQVCYSLNEPAAARNYQAVFWNISYYDKTYFDAIFEDFVFPDGTVPTWESVSWLQKFFMKWFNRERLRNYLTFPVETVNLVYDKDTKKYKDEEWADFAAEMWSEGHSFFCYNSDSADSLSSCCFHGDEMIEVIEKDSGQKLSLTMQGFCERISQQLNTTTYVGETGYQIVSINPQTQQEELTDITGVLIKGNDHKSLIEIEVEDGHPIKVTPDHILLVSVGGQVVGVPAGVVACEPERYELFLEG